MEDRPIAHRTAIDTIPVVRDETVRWVAEHWRPTPEPGLPAFAFVSVPFDYAVSHRPGTRFGPEKMLELLNQQSLYCVDKRVSLEAASLVHCGAVDIVHSFEHSYANIRKAVAGVPLEATPIILGGDHSITDPAIRGIQDRQPDGRFGLIVFDAHFDSREPVAGKEHSGHWMYTLRDAIDYGRSVQLGINASIYSERYMQTAEAAGVMVRTPYDIRRHGLAATLAEAVAHASRDTDGIYVSVDIDAIDQSQAPGTSVPNPVGLWAHEVIDGVFEVAAAAPTVALDITEVSPPLDTDDRTSRVGVQIILNFMAGAVRRARSASR